MQIVFDTGAVKLVRQHGVQLLCVGRLLCGFGVDRAVVHPNANPAFVLM